MSDRLISWTVAALLSATPALAQNAGQPTTGYGQDAMPPAASEQPAAQSNAGTIIPAETASQVRAEKLLGMKVVNGAGEELGTIDDIVIDEDGKVSGLVVKTGGVMGIGGKAVAIAWRDVGGAIHADAVNISLTKDALDKAPAFKTKEDQQDAANTPRPLQPLPKPSR